MKRTIRTALTAALTLPFLVTSTLPAMSAQYKGFKLENISNRRISRFYVAPSNNKRLPWGNNILGSRGLYPGRFVTVTVNRPTCWYDFKSVMSNGRALYRYNVDVCNLGTYTIY